MSTEQAVQSYTNAAGGQVSLRDYYVGIALSALLAARGASERDRAKTNIWSPDHLADKAVEIADATIRRLDRSI